MLAAGGCADGATTGSADATDATASATDGSTTDGSTTDGSTTDNTGGTAAVAAAGSIFDPTVVHEIAVDIDPDVLTELIATYADTAAKDWASASVTIDGQVFENVGIKLKGNSSLQGLTADSDPTSLPWRIRLDKYVEGQELDGYTDFAIRPNGSESSFNEAVALDLLAAAGLATEKAIATSFSVNGADAVLRLTVQNLDETWVTEQFPDAGADSVLYKVDSNVDWSYQGDDADYSDSFDIKAGPTNYAPLAALLDLVNNGSAEEIAEQLPTMLDIDSFATYVALEDLIGNFDTISGPGNNGYLFWDSSTEMFTVVAWDHDRAYGVQLGMGGAGGGNGPGMGGGPGRTRPTDPPQGDAASLPEGMEFPEGMAPPEGMEFPEGMAPPEGMELPEGMEPPSGVDGATGTRPGFGGRGAPADGTAGEGQGRGFPGGGNPLSTAFAANADWAALVTAKTAELRASLYDSGVLADAVAAWLTAVVPSGLVPEATLQQEADAILSYAEQ